MIQHLPLLLLLLISVCAELNEFRDSTSHNLRWKKVSVYNPRQKKNIIEPTSYNLLSGHTLGILGPSGSGKSTFLTALAGILPSSTLTSSGDVTIYTSQNNDQNNAKTPPLRHLQLADVAFLAQDDSFFSMLTVRETLETEEELQFKRNKDYRKIAEKNRRNVINALGLNKLLNRRVGDRRLGGTTNQNGLSGGERRRLSVAVEMIGDVKVILADEPTTGLDSSQAQKVVHKIADIAKTKGITAILALHAPRGSIYELLDDVFLLAPNGIPIFIGPAASACQYFARLGHKCPPNSNIAEFLIDLVSVDTEDEEQATTDLARIQELAVAFRKEEARRQGKEEARRQGNEKGETREEGAEACVTKHKHRSRRRLSFLKRVAVLVKRSFRQNFRDTAVNGLRLGACGILSFVFSAIFGENLKGEPTAKSVADRTALLSYAVINMAMMSLMKTLDLFGKEKPVVMRERMRGHYGGTEYIVAKVIAEVPLDASFSIVFATLLKKYTNLNVPTTRLAATLGMTTICTDLLGFAVGSVCSTGDAALAVGTPLMIIYMVLGIINPAGATKNGNDSLPWFLKLLKYASPIRWAIESLCCAEFRGLKLSRKGRPSMGALALVNSGDQVLEALGLGDKEWISGIKKLAKLGGIELLISICAQHIFATTHSG
ncbi:hypothetical protein TrCOL_g4617 [Triparma columacea]|uniref:ABC transporter domain-containing protein n=1 Tax=Triparma columacea TaxID=722753 RepID=A0A9W7G063_9STRA|nr:hypothetical protein TrCOL_g4617 [Triparma columacea]